jgi:Protein of unknown function (DUF2637)
MSAANRAQAITRWGAVALMATAVLTATAGGFAQSYAGLYHWALEHGLRGWKAESFPLLVDLFIIVGELGLFLLAIDAYVIRRRQLMSWLDFCLPLTIALAGWTTSLLFNIGHVGHKSFSYQATAAVPPIVAMLGLFVLLRTLHRYVQNAEEERQNAEGASRAIAPPVTLHQVTLMPMRVTGPFPQVPPVPATRPEKAIEPSGPARAARTATAEAGQAAAEPRLATVAAATRTSTNGHGRLDNAALAEPEIETPKPSPEALRKAVTEALERNNGFAVLAHDEVNAAGYECGEDEVQRIRDDHWFPYKVYMLLARHHGDAEQVARDLRAAGITYDQAALDDIAKGYRR